LVVWQSSFSRIAVKMLFSDHHSMPVAKKGAVPLMHKVLKLLHLFSMMATSKNTSSEIVQW